MKKLVFFAMFSLLCSCTIDKCKFELSLENPSDGYMCLYDEYLEMTVDSIDFENEDDICMKVDDIDADNSYILTIHVENPKHRPFTNEYQIDKFQHSPRGCELKTFGFLIGKLTMQGSSFGLRMFVIMLCILSVIIMSLILICVVSAIRGDLHKKKQKNEEVLNHSHHVEDVMKKYHIKGSNSHDKEGDIATQRNVVSNKKNPEEELKIKQETAAKRKAAEGANRKVVENAKRIVEDNAKKAEEKTKRKIDEDKKVKEQEVKRQVVDSYEVDTENKVLKIIGSGEIPDDWHPWPFTLTVKEIVIPNTVTYIGAHVFDKSLTLRCKKIIIPDSVERIGNNAFRGFPNNIRRKIVLGKNIKEIGVGSFLCEGGPDFAGVDVYCRSAIPPKLGHINTLGNALLMKVYIPKGSLVAYLQAPLWNQIKPSRFYEKDAEIIGREDEIKAAAKAQQRAEEKARLKAEEEARRKAEEEAKRLADFEASERIRIEAEMRKEMGL